MTDRQLLHAFESTDLEPGTFGHTDHVRVAFAYLLGHDLWTALAKIREGLRRFASAAGAPGKYHETVTCALVFMIHERMTSQPEVRLWEDFAAANPDLLRWEDGPFFHLYPPDVLGSEVARRTFLLPPAAVAAVAP